MQNDPCVPFEFYDLNSEPQARTNLAESNKRMFDELSTALRKLFQRSGATRWQNR